MEILTWYRICTPHAHVEHVLFKIRPRVPRTSLRYFGEAQIAGETQRKGDFATIWSAENTV